MTTAAIITLLRHWKMMGTPDTPQSKEWKRPRLTENFLEPHPPPVTLDEEGRIWDAKGFKMVVDCQPLANVLNGTSPWVDDNNIEEGKAVINEIHELTSKYGLSNLCATPVVWRQRGTKPGRRLLTEEIHAYKNQLGHGIRQCSSVSPKGRGHNILFRRRLQTR